MSFKSECVIKALRVVLRHSNVRLENVEISYLRPPLLSSRRRLPIANRLTSRNESYHFRNGRGIQYHLIFSLSLLILLVSEVSAIESLPEMELT